uniref:Uncharacterized protein n=1 Tax=Chromera velia CCMP2878 TaxID=1169474 RepID=A0A0G4F9I8_9ALVE|eukprot:Cvel_2995.t1-p1 / transcript=Cvel_2995.t1 / gene=Cvel_2995 / organism=Chromera_velia_CCMP2878 / gene_product=hypothetical protein / transcript_product=hypothetical protein / location=Cvel_scaffold119:56867-67884(+) / protein_length=349 / sequence_SO=supercontig / SO=protein_coding / is_pseudo=false
MMMRGGKWFTGGETEEERANCEVQLQANIVLIYDRTPQAGELAEVAREAIRQQEYLNANTYLNEAEALMYNSTKKAQPEVQPEEATQTRSCQGQQHLAIAASAAPKIERKKRRRETGHQGGATGSANRTPLQGQSRTTAATAAAPAAVAPAAAAPTAVAPAATLAAASSPSAGPPRVRGRDSELHGAGTVLPSSRFSLAGAFEVAKRIVSDGRGKEAKFDPAGVEVEGVDEDEAKQENEAPCRGSPPGDACFGSQSFLNSSREEQKEKRLVQRIHSRKERRQLGRLTREAEYLAAFEGRHFPSEPLSEGVLRLTSSGRSHTLPRLWIPASIGGTSTYGYSRERWVLSHG